MKSHLIFAAGSKALDLILNLSIISIIALSSSELKGSVAASLIFITLIASLLGINWGTSALHHISRKPEDRESILSSCYWSCITWSISLSVILYFVLKHTNVLHLAEINASHNVILGMTLFYLSFTITNSMRTHILLKKGSNTVHHILLFSRVAMFAFIFVFYKLEMLTLMEALTGYVLFWSVQATIYLVIARQKIHFFFKSVKIIPTYMLYASIAQISIVGSYLIFSSDILILNLYVSKEDVGNYSLCMDIILAALALLQAMSLVFFNKADNPETKGTSWVEVRKFIYTLIALTIVGSLASMIILPYLIKIFFGHPYSLASNLITILIWCIPGHAISSLLGRFWITSGKMTQASLWAIVIGTTNLILNSLLIPEFGVYGAAIASLIASVISGTVNFIYMLSLNKATTTQSLRESTTP